MDLTALTTERSRDFGLIGDDLLDKQPEIGHQKDTAEC